MADETTTAAEANEEPKIKAKKPPKVQLDKEKWLEPDGLLLVTAYARDGLSRKEMAKKMGIGLTTLHRYLNEFPNFRDAVKRGKEWADVTVENALCKSATGYTVTVRKPIKLRTVKVRDGNRIETEEVQYVNEDVHIPANTTAQIFYLKNRKPEAWRDRPAETETIAATGPLVTIINDIPDVPQPTAETPTPAEATQ